MVRVLHPSSLPAPPHRNRRRPQPQSTTDTDTFYVVPLEFDQARVPAQGKLRVYRTQDAGNTWQPLGDGLPQRHVLQGAYRQALCKDAAPQSATLGLYLGTSGGHLYASTNGSENWQQILDHLAPVTAVRCQHIH